MSISAVVLAYNDADTIRKCLDSLAWTDEIVVVLSPSTDGTDEIVRQLADTVVTIPPAGPGEPFDHFRQEGIAAAIGEWIVDIDADEWIPETLARRFREIVDEDEADIVWTSTKSYIDGRWLDGGMWWPAKAPKLLRKGHFNITEDVHQYLTVDDSARVIDLPAEGDLATRHYPFDGYRHAFRRDLNYAQIVGKQQEPSWRRLLGSIPYTFFDTYVRRGNYVLGLDGVVLSLSRAWFRFAAAVYAMRYR